MSEWITDRKPNIDDAPDKGKYKGHVWISGISHSQTCPWNLVDEGEPWQRIEFITVPVKPDPYVKTKTWVRERCSDEPYWQIRDTRTGELSNIAMKCEDTARKLEAFLNKVMP